MSKKQDKKDTLGARIKAYEKIFKIYAKPKSYIVARYDGKSFHTYVNTLNELNRPFDDRIISAIDTSMLAICKSQNALFGYCQSDEITIVFDDFGKDTTQQIYGGSLTKIISIGASIITEEFNKVRIYQELESVRQNLLENTFKLSMSTNEFVTNVIIDSVKIKMDLITPAYFDGRAICLNDGDLRKLEYWKLKFVETPELIKENLALIEMRNSVYWRFEDCVRNSISGKAQHHFSHNELHKKSTLDMLSMLRNIGSPWEDLSEAHKFGRMCVKDNGKYVVKPMWDLKDYDIRTEFYKTFLK